MAELSEDDARRLVNTVTELVQMADRALPRHTSALTRRLRAHLGVDGDAVPNTSISMPTLEQANLQLALNAVEADATSWEVIGLPADIGHHSGASLPALLSGEHYGLRVGARQFVTVDIDLGETLACLRAGVVLTEHDGEPVALAHYVREFHRPEIVVEVVASTQHAADGFLALIRQLMDQHNVFRGKVLSFAFGRHGEFGVTFAAVPEVDRSQVILPARLLDAVEEHALGISAHREELVAAGQHVKRGLLLFGPPGTGKTHTISYLLNRTRGRTTIILSGAAVGAVGQAGTIARNLQPATIVIEDVDLIGMDRSLPGGDHNSMLFQLLNEMDGLGGDADVLFILTTNRVDLLEPALAARPGRVDQAIEIPLPDADARRRLIELYVGDVLEPAVVEQVVAGTEGVAAAFIKELARRATVASIRSDASLSETIVPALDALLHQSAPVLRRTLAGELPVSGPGQPPSRPEGWAFFSQ